MLGNSPLSPQDPDSPVSSSLEPLVEEDEESHIVNALMPVANAPAPKAIPPNPLADKDKRAATTTVTTLKERVFQPPEPKRFTAMEKGKGRENVAVNHPRSSGAIEKENDAKGSKPSVPMATKPAKVMAVSGIGDGNSTGTTSRPRLMGKLPPGKPRRVPIGSADAAVPVGRGWRG